MTNATFDCEMGARLRSLRTSRGWSQADLALALAEQGLRFFPQTIVKVEKGVRSLRLKEGAAVARAFDMTILEFLNTAPTAPDDEAIGKAVRDVHRARAASARAMTAVAVAEDRLRAVLDVSAGATQQALDRAETLLAGS